MGQLSAACRALLGWTGEGARPYVACGGAAGRIICESDNPAEFCF